VSYKIHQSSKCCKDCEKRISQRFSRKPLDFVSSPQFPASNLIQVRDSSLPNQLLRHHAAVENGVGSLLHGHGGDDARPRRWHHPRAARPWCWCHLTTVRRCARFASVRWWLGRRRCDFIRFLKKPNGKLRLSTDLSKILFSFLVFFLDFEIWIQTKFWPILSKFMKFIEIGEEPYWGSYQYLDPWCTQAASATLLLQFVAWRYYWRKVHWDRTLLVRQLCVQITEATLLFMGGQEAGRPHMVQLGRIGHNR
jgi:hypothetical protein